jgi:hypothetical protein
MKRVVQEVPERYAKTAHEVDEEADRKLGWQTIGETKPTLAGYSVRVGRVQFDRGGARIRMKLLQNGIFLKHLDITTDIAGDLGPILQDAASIFRR